MSSSALYASLASGVEMLHALTMIVWGLGLPFLVWHRYQRLSRLYMWYALSFVVVSVLSDALLDECVLTTWARHLWQEAGGFRERVPFIVTFTNAVAGFRPSTRAAVLAWEIAIVLTSIGTLWSWRKASRARSSSNDKPGLRT